MASKNGRQLIVLAFTIAVGLLLAWLARRALLIIYVSSVFAVVLKPAIDWLHRTSLLGWRPGRAAALLVLILFFGALLGGMMAIALPSMVSSVSDFAGTFAAQSEPLQKRLHSIPVLRNLNLSSLQAQLSSFVSTILPVIGGATTAILTGILLTAYLILDGAALLDRTLRLVPGHQRPRLQSALERAATRMRRWLRGQAMLMAILGTSAAVTFGLMGLPYFYLLAAFAAVANIVPMLGPLATVLIASAVAATQSLWHVAGVIIFYLVYQQVESAFLTPNIMKSQAQISSSVVIIALLIGSELGGIAGALVGVPSAILIGEMVDEYLMQHPRAE